MSQPTERHSQNLWEFLPPFPFTVKDAIPPDWIRAIHMKGTLVQFPGNKKHVTPLETCLTRRGHLSVQFPSIRDDFNAIYSIQLLSFYQTPGTLAGYRITPRFNGIQESLTMDNSSIVTLMHPKSPTVPLATMAFDPEIGQATLTITMPTIPVQCLIGAGDSASFTFRSDLHVEPILVRDFTKAHNRNSRHTSVQIQNQSYREQGVYDTATGVALFSDSTQICSVFLGWE